MKRGFSLVELSIVLVILGLLTGGILTGQNLIRAAELRSVTTEFTAYQTAVLTFRDKYFALPGDMRNATDFWGAAHSTPATCRTTASTGTETCNGDANGKIESTGNSTEQVRFWQHMANAGLVEGTYTGVSGSAGGIHFEIGYNIPTSKLANAGWGAHYRTATSDTNFYDGDHGNTLQFGAASASGSNYIGIISPEEAWNIDTKIDDGKPGKGRVMAIHWDVCGGASAANDYDSDYVLTTTSAECALMFPKPF